MPRLALGRRGEKIGPARQLCSLEKSQPKGFKKTACQLFYKKKDEKVPSISSHHKNHRGGQGVKEWADQSHWRRKKSDEQILRGPTAIEF